MADEEAESRIYDGINFRFDNKFRLISRVQYRELHFLEFYAAAPMRLLDKRLFKKKEIKALKRLIFSMFCNILSAAFVFAQMLQIIQAEFTIGHEFGSAVENVIFNQKNMLNRSKYYCFSKFFDLCF